MSISLEAKQKNIFDIFNIREQYNIPEYQRPYSWGFDECYMLYMDLIEAFENNEDYFLGNIILARSNNLETQFKLDVIDGQQRLTSLLLILRVLNLFYSEHKGPGKCLWLESLESDERFIRIESEIIELSEEKSNLKKAFEYTKEYLENKRDEVVRNSEIDIKKLDAVSFDKFHKNLIAFYSLFYHYFENLSSDSMPVSRFINFLINKVSMLPIELQGSNKDEATEKALKIFETINNRGLNLSDADIFKSKLFILAEEKHDFTSSWNELIEKTESLNTTVNDLFRYYSHVIRGQEGIVSGEISLREFFTVKDYSPLKTKSFNYIMGDLFKICDLLEEWQTNLNNKSPFSKWLHLIDVYTNSFPKYALMAYLFKNGFDEDLEGFLIYLVKFVFSKGSTTYIKWDMYPLIYKVTSTNQKMFVFNTKNSVDESVFSGRLKKGFVLLAHYLKYEHVSPSSKIGRLFSANEIKLLSSKWKVEESELNEILTGVANYDVYNEAKELKNKKIELERSFDVLQQHDDDLKKAIIQFLESA